MNKLTGHHNKDHTTDAHQHGTPYTNNGQTTTTTTQTTTNNTALPNQSINQQSTLGGLNNSANIASTAPYGTATADAAQRTGAAYSNTGVNNQALTNQQLANQQRPLHDDAITRSEEQLRLSKASVETGVAALNKYVSVDHVEKQVPIIRERLVIERFPINESNLGSFSNAIIGEQHFETTVCEDRIAAMKEIVPIERIRLAKEVQGTVENISADLKKERVDYQYQPYGNKHDDGLAHDAQARHDFSYDTHRKTDSSYDQAAQYDPTQPKPHSSKAIDSLPGTHHHHSSGVHGSGTNVLSDKIDNIGKTGHGAGAGFMQGNALAGGTGGA